MCFRTSERSEQTNGRSDVTFRLDEIEKWKSKPQWVIVVEEVDKNTELRSCILLHLLRLVNMWFILHRGILFGTFCKPKYATASDRKVI